MKSRRHRGRAPLPWDAIVPHLGDVSDYTLAREHHCSVEGIREMRIRLGIPSRTERLTKSRQAELGAILGRVPDRVVAETFDVDIATARRWRYRAGIRSHGHPGLATRPPKRPQRTSRAKPVRLRPELFVERSPWMFR